MLSAFVASAAEPAQLLPARTQMAFTLGIHIVLVPFGVAFERDPHLVAKMPDHDLWLAFFRDPEGNVLALMCEVKR